jgi:hypothetical protein
MESLYDITISFWQFWFGDMATTLEDTLQLISVICVIAMVFSLIILPIFRVIAGFSRKRRG